MFVESFLDKEAVWLLGIYVKLVWDNVICKKKILSQNFVKTECSLKYFIQYT